MNDCITTTKQSTTKRCAYFLGYTVYAEHATIKHIWGMPDGELDIISETKLQQKVIVLFLFIT